MVCYCFHFVYLHVFRVLVDLRTAQAKHPVVPSKELKNKNTKVRTMFKRTPKHMEVFVFFLLNTGACIR